jgi:cellulose 1,4-beta-cellobiosidase
MASKATAPTALATAIDKAAILPTGVWLDRIAAIDGSPERLGLEGHLNEALAQQAQSADPSQPMLVTLVVYDLPDRDCAAFASNGELLLAEDGLSRYREAYIDEIASRIKANPAYQSLRIVTILEPDSLPNLVTNLGIYAACRDAEPGYREGVKYAVSTLGAIDNVYAYLDIAHSGWLGWEHTQRAAQVYQEVLGQDLDKIRGFAVNVANYSALREPSDPYADVNANRDVIEGFYEWNRIIDEETYVQELRKYFPDKGIVIDTSRNGWRATSDGSPIEKRTHRGNWCNIDGAGMGERPRANPEPGVDAYFFIKPPGESDGTSDAGATSPNEDGKRFDPMCGQAPVERPYAAGETIPTDALAGAPHAGQWFHEQFLMLVENATPPL